MRILLRLFHTHTNRPRVPLPTDGGRTYLERELYKNDVTSPNFAAFFSLLPSVAHRWSPVEDLKVVYVGFGVPIGWVHVNNDYMCAVQACVPANIPLTIPPSS